MREQVDQFLHYLKYEKGYADNTIAAYRNDLNQFLAFLKSETWSQVTEKHIALYVQELAHLRYADSTVARKVASVKSFFHHLVDVGSLIDDPTATLDSPRVKKSSPQTLCKEDIEKLVAAPLKSTTPKALRDAALLSLIYSTGMRVSEVVSLQLDNIDLEKRIIHCAGRDGQERQLPLDQSATTSLLAYLEKGRHALLGGEREDTLFLNHRGHPLSRQGLWLIVKSYAEAAAIGQDVTPHALRHSFAAHRLECGSSLNRMQELLGHASRSATKIYAQFIQPSDETTSDD